MDVSGDGIVSEDEFMVVYMKLHPESLPSEYKALWTKIDQNQDGTLQPEELAAYFGFDFGQIAKDMEDEIAAEKAMEEMDDDAILNALRMEQTLREVNQRPRPASGGASPAPRRSRNRTVSREDTGIEVIKLPTKITTIQPRAEVELLWASETGDAIRINELISEGVNVRIEDERGEMPVHKLCKQGDTRTIRAILAASENRQPGSKKKDLNTPTRAGKTPLMVAAEYNHADLMNYLIDVGVELQAESSCGWTALHYVVNCNNVELLTTFLSNPNVVRCKKFLLNHQDHDQRTAAHIAGFKCDEGVVQRIVNEGANVDIVDVMGNTPMKLALRNGRSKSRDIMEAYSKGYNKSTSTSTASSLAPSPLGSPTSVPVGGEVSKSSAMWSSRD